MKTEVVKITDTLEVIRDVDNPDFVDFTDIWRKNAPRDENGNPNKNYRPCEWFRLPTTERYILFLRYTLSQDGKGSLLDLWKVYRGGHHRGGTFGHRILQVFRQKAPELQPGDEWRHYVIDSNYLRWK